MPSLLQWRLMNATLGRCQQACPRQCCLERMAPAPNDCEQAATPIISITRNAVDVYVNMFLLPSRTWRQPMRAGKPASDAIASMLSRASRTIPRAQCMEPCSARPPLRC
jgi:hypothetical protein